MELQASRCLHLQIRSHLYLLAHLHLDVVHPFLAIAQTPAAAHRQIVVPSPGCPPLRAVATFVVAYLQPAESVLRTVLASLVVVGYEDRQLQLMS